MNGHEHCEAAMMSLHQQLKAEWALADNLYETLNELDLRIFDGFTVRKVERAKARYREARQR
jgi:hypothetical protein